MSSAVRNSRLDDGRNSAAYGNFFGTSFGLMFTREGISFGVLFTRCLQNTHCHCGTSTTRRMPSTAARTRVKQERRRQSWCVAFSEQKDKPIRCRVSITRDGRRANQERNSTFPARGRVWFAFRVLLLGGWICSLGEPCPLTCPLFF